MKYTKTEHVNVKVTYPNDCGNAPKKIVLRDFTIAAVTNNEDFIFENIADDLLWEIIGYKQIQGKENVIDFLRETAAKDGLELNIHSIITHGKTASLNGSLLLMNRKVYDFCHVYLFTSAGKNAKLKEITSYIIETSE